jgi:hypothetical protein
MPTPRFQILNFTPLFGVLLSAALLPGQACATLGEPESTVQIDAEQSLGSIKAMNDRQTYRVHEIQMPGGTVLREFVSPAGSVFAVAWKGPTMPNMRQVLGSYYDRYVAGAKLNRENHGDHKHLQIQQADFVVQVGGHMRAWAGRVYLPTALPDGFDLGDLH